MENLRVVITQKETAVLQPYTVPESAPQAGELLIRTECSFISAGTELSIFTGNDPGTVTPGAWCQWPWAAGYGNVGIVEKVGEGVDDFETGDRVFSFGPHATRHLYESHDPFRMIAKVAPEVTSVRAAASRMAHVALTALDLSSQGYNRWVAVWGLGMVGNLSAQQFQIAGNRVIGVDPSPVRRELALKCGIPYAIGGTNDEVREQIRDITGRGADITVDAVGHSAICEQALLSTADFGELIILGTPRVPYQGDFNTIFNPTHRRWITIKGGLEWRIPARGQMPYDHSQVKKHEALMAWLADGRLKIDPLITHVLPPTEIQTAYEGLLHKKDEYIGVVLDWAG